MGAKKHPFYRIVVTEQRGKRDGRFVEVLGFYDPCSRPEQIKIDQDRVAHWMRHGAQPTDVVSRLLKRTQSV